MEQITKTKHVTSEAAADGIKVSAPWFEYGRKLKTLFQGEPDIIVDMPYRYCEDDINKGLMTNGYVIDILVRNHNKFLAMDKSLPKEKFFGNVRVRINIYDTENSELKDTSPSELIKVLFKDNPNVDDILELSDFSGTTHTFVIFKPEVKQFYNDDISSPNGLWSGLEQDIAKEIFSETNLSFVHFCTSATRNPVE